MWRAWGRREPRDEARRGVLPRGRGPTDRANRLLGDHEATPEAAGPARSEAAPGRPQGDAPGRRLGPRNGVVGPAVVGRWCGSPGLPDRPPMPLPGDDPGRPPRVDPGRP